MARAVTTHFGADDAAGIDGPPGRWSSALGRFGLTARGVLYLVLGFLTLQFAFGETGNAQVSNQGAIRFVRQAPFGTLLLWALAAGLAAFALWQFTLVFTGDPVRGSGAAERALLGIKGLLYGATGATIFLAASGGSASSGGSENTKATAFVLELPFGQWVVGAIGVGVVGYSLRSFVRHGKDAAFMERLRVTQMDPGTVSAVRTAGRVGYGGRAVVIALTGGLLVVAAVQHSPEQSRGLAGSLLALSQQPYGTWLLAGVAVGLALFGVFCVVEARYRRAA